MIFVIGTPIHEFLAPTSRSSFRSARRLITFGSGSVTGGSYIFTCQMRCIFQLCDLTAESLPQQTVTDIGNSKGATLLMGILFVVPKEVFELSLNGHKKPHLSRGEFCVFSSLGKTSFVGVHAQIPDQGPVGNSARASGYISVDGGETELPITPADCIEGSTL